MPLALQTETFAVVSGRQSNEQILAALGSFDNVAILKAGRRRPGIIAAIQRANRISDACYIEFAGQANERIVRDIQQLEPGQGPYFSLFLVIARRDNPEAGQ